MAQTIDEVHCKLPDYYMYKTLTCACGDEAVKITERRAALNDHAYWCTGSLKLLDWFGKVTYVNNPYSFLELLLRLGDTVDPYLRCISQLGDGTGEQNDCSALKPWVDGIDNFNALDVVSISVLQRCRANYQQVSLSLSTRL